MEVERVSSVFFLFNSISYLINSCRNEHALFLIFKFNLFRVNLTGAIPIVEIWMNLLTSFPKWNVEKNILYLLDILVRTARMDPVSDQSCRPILSVVLHLTKSNQSIARLKDLYRLLVIGSGFV